MIYVVIIMVIICGALVGIIRNQRETIKDCDSLAAAQNNVIAKQKDVIRIQCEMLSALGYEVTP